MSEHGKTKKEHLKQTTKFPSRLREVNINHHKLHYELARKLSDKEHSDEEVGINNNKKQMSLREVLADPEGKKTIEAIEHVDINSKRS